MLSDAINMPSGVLHKYRKNMPSGVLHKYRKNMQSGVLHKYRKNMPFGVLYLAAKCSTPDGTCKWTNGVALLGFENSV